MSARLSRKSQQLPVCPLRLLHLLLPDSLHLPSWCKASGLPPPAQLRNLQQDPSICQLDPPTPPPAPPPLPPHCRYHLQNCQSRLLHSMPRLDLQQFLQGLQFPLQPTLWFLNRSLLCLLDRLDYLQLAHLLLQCPCLLTLHLSPLLRLRRLFDPCSE